MPRPFSFTPLESAAIAQAGAPSNPIGQSFFEEMIADTKGLIQNGAGLTRSGLQTLIEERMVELATQRFNEQRADMPEGFDTVIREDAGALAEAIADNLSFVVVATVLNMLSKVDAQGLPVISFAMTPADADQDLPVPLVANRVAIPRPI